MNVFVLETDDIVIDRSYISIQLKYLFLRRDMIYFVETEEALEAIILTCDQLIIEMDLCNGYITPEYIDALMRIADIIGSIKPYSYCAYISNSTLLFLEALSGRISRLLDKVVEMFRDSIEEETYSPSFKIERNGYISARKVC